MNLVSAKSHDIVTGKRGFATLSRAENRDGRMTAKVIVDSGKVLLSRN